MDKITASDKDIDMTSISSIRDERERQNAIKIMKEKKKEEKLKKIENNVAKCLKMVNVGERTAKVINYSNETTIEEKGKLVRNHSIDEQMCELWNKLLVPAHYRQFKNDK